MIIPAAYRLTTVKEYYFSQKLREIAELRANGKEIINLGIGSPDLAPESKVVDVLCQSAQNVNHHGYQPYAGIPELRDAISKWNKTQYGINIHSNEVLPLLGSKEGIMHISMAFLNPGDKVLVPNPGYPSYSSVTNLLQAESVTYDLTEKNNWQPDIDAIKRLPLDEIKLMWINTPNMPTGMIWNQSNLAALISLAKRHRFLIINDNPYSLILNNRPSSILQQKDAKEVCLELNSLSKTYNMAGWRLGWVSGKKEYLDTIIKVKSNVDSGMFLPIQHAAIEALKHNDEWIHSLNKEYTIRRNLIIELFEQLNCSYDKNQVGMFVWAKIPANKKTEVMVDELLYEKGVFITPGFIFGSNGENYLRASLCSTQQTIKKAISKIKTA